MSQREPQMPRHVTALICVALASACAGPTDHRPEGGASTASPSVAVEGGATARELEPDSSDRLIERAAGSKQCAEALERLIAVEKALTGSPLVAGNRVHLLVDGPAAYAAMFRAISGARHHIHLETYILADDEMGQRVADLLVERRSHRVEVRLIYDGLGSASVSEAFLQRLRDAGVELRAFRPIDPLENPELWKHNHRDHRKILVVDGRVGFTGGMNISGVYSSSSSAPPEEDEEEAAPPTEGGWRDTQIQISGPAVGELQKLFVEQWNELDPATALPAAGKRYFPTVRPAGTTLVRIIASEGGDDQYEIYHAYLAAVEHARRRVWVTQAYFVPDERMMQVLGESAQRGVDVRLLVPGLSDHAIVVQASRAFYQRLLDAGVRIYERSDAMVHAKTAVVDGVWSTVGSSNLNNRSFVQDDEANAVVVSRRFGREMEDLFRVDIEHAREIEAVAWRERPLSERVLQGLSRLVVRIADAL